MSNKKTNLGGQKQNKDFFVQSTFSLENGREMQFLTTPLWGCRPCDKLNIFVLN